MDLVIEKILLMIPVRKMIEICQISWGADSKKASNRLECKIFVWMVRMIFWFSMRFGSKRRIATQLWRFLKRQFIVLVTINAFLNFSLANRRKQPIKGCFFLWCCWFLGLLSHFWLNVLWLIRVFLVLLFHWLFWFLR